MSILEINNQIASDNPETDVSKDTFGYANFARRIAAGIRNAQSPKGLVMAIHGPWGAGKTTFLNYVRHWLRADAEDMCPIIMEFNPWWFSGHEQLAGQFLAQFRAQLVQESEVLRKIGDSLAEYSKEIGVAVEASISVPFTSKIVQFLLKMLGRKPIDVPKLKATISNQLLKSEQRFVVVVDDIDRLTPDEMVQCFRVIKAVADFPNVVYLLAFERSTVAQAVGTVLSVDGEAYLEKIVQAPFALPVVNHQLLNKKLLENLGEIVGETDKQLFDPTHWGNVYHGGLAQLIAKPRDIVRICNALAVTYPAVRDEVNTTDFIALEFLRVFLPETYAVIRDNRSHFSSAAIRSPSSAEKAVMLAFHEQWLQEVPEQFRDGIKSVVQRLFPHLNSVWSNHYYDSGFWKQWRSQCRICSEVFPVYFELGINSSQLSRRELMALVHWGSDLKSISKELLAAASIVRPDGSLKIFDYLSQLCRLEAELSASFVSSALASLLAIGDHLLRPSDFTPGFGDAPGAWKVCWLIEHLIRRIPDSEREPRVIALVHDALAIGTVVTFIAISEDRRKKALKEEDDSVAARFSEQTINELKRIAVEHIESHAINDEFLKNPYLGTLLQHWSQWKSPETVRAWMHAIVQDDAKLLALLVGHLQYGTTSVVGDHVGRRIPMLNPKSFESFFDLGALEARIEFLSSNRELSGTALDAVQTFLRGMKAVRAGRDPALSGSFGDDA